MYINSIYKSHPQTLNQILSALPKYISDALIIYKNEKNSWRLALPSELSYSIKSACSIQKLNDGHVACVHNKKYVSYLMNLTKGVCIVPPSLKNLLPTTVESSNDFFVVVHEKPYRLFALILAILYKKSVHQTSGIHSSAIIAKDAFIDPTVMIGPNVVVGSGVLIGAGTIIQANCYIDQGVKIGKNCTIESMVTLSCADIGDHVHIKSGAKIGQQGFGFDMDSSGPIDVVQLGNVIVGNNVQIGANTTIDRGSLNNTVIGDGCRIDNLVQIAHNVVLGKGCIIVAQTGIAGSTTLGDFVIVGGQVGIAGHLNIGNGVQIAAQSGLIRNVNPKEIVGGYPAVPIKNWHQQTIYLQNVIKKKEGK